MRDIFRAMPLEALPVLSTEVKSTLLEGYDKKQKGEVVPEVRNMYNGTSEILQLTEDFIQVRLDSAVTMELQKLPLRGKKYQLGMILTSNTAPAQSVLVFYDEMWTRLEGEAYNTTPELADFFTDPSRLETNETKQVLGQIGAVSYRYSWVVGANKLRVVVTTFEEKTNKSLFPQATQWLKGEGVYYTWKRGELRKEN